MIRAVKVNLDYVDALRNIDDKVYDNKRGIKDIVDYPPSLDIEP